MNFSILCQFERPTACGIHMDGKAKALIALGHSVCLLHHPFKYQKKLPGKLERVNPNYQKVDIYSSFFESPKSGIKKLLLIPVFMWELSRGLRFLRKSNYVFIHKPLPLGLLYMYLLKFSFYRGKIISIIDDWEGVGGMATIRQADSTVNKLLATLSDEHIPVIANGNICSSRLSLKKLELSNKSSGKNIWIPLGASEISASLISNANKKFKVGYVGSFKSKPLIDFLCEIIQSTLKIEEKIEFTIIGGGDDYPYLCEKIESLNVGQNLRLTGQVSHDQVNNYLQEFSLCLLYLNDEFPENYIDASRSSTKMFEYMAMGKIIVASDFGEPKNIIRNNRTGFLVDNNPDKFAKKIHYVYKNQHLIGQMAPNIISDFKSKFSHNILMGKVIEWLPTL